ncbi:MAG: hypothetical protein AAGD06_22815 [Acidobacteriota bacterium]
MNKKTPFRFTVAAAILGTAASLVPGVALAAELPKGDEGEIRVISPELFDALGGWSEAEVSVGAIAVEEYPQTVAAYVPQVEALYRGRSLASHFAENYPEAFKEYLEAVDLKGTEGDASLVAVEVEDSNDFFAYVATHRDAEFRKFQQEEQLVREGLRFEDFVRRNFPSVVSAAEERKMTPAKRGMRFTDYLATIDRRDLEEEAWKLLDTVKTEDGDDCACWTVVTFPRQPYGWQQEIDEHKDRRWGFPRKREKLDYTVYADGAAKEIDFERHTRRTLWEQDRLKATNYTQMRVRMHCTEGGAIGGVQCEAGTCTGELAIRAEYGSRVYQRVDVGGIWSKESRSLASDLAQFVYDVPGPAPQMTLFEKGVAVSGHTKTNWNSEAVIDVLVNGAQIALILAGDETSVGDLLEDDLVNETLTGIMGLITREGDESEHQQDMYAAFDTAGTAPFPLSPNVTHLFTLDTTAKVYGRGYGGSSTSWATVNSSNFLVAVGRNYQCSDGTTAPTPRAHWQWATGGGPHSSTTLRNLVADWVFTEIGAYPPNTSSGVGQFPQ